MTDTSELRQRKLAPTKEEEAPRKARAKASADKEDRYTPWVDILRVLTFLFVASCALSYLVSSGESLFWGMQHKPKYMRLEWWKSHFVRSAPVLFRILALGGKPRAYWLTHTTPGTPHRTHSRGARQLRRHRPY